MVSQNGKSELTVGDSHEYGSSFSPFDEAYINELIISYLKTFAIIEKAILTFDGNEASMYAIQKFEDLFYFLIFAI